MWGVVNGIMTLLALVTFVGIVIWAWSAHRAEANRQAAWLPFALPEESREGGPAGESHE